MDEYRHAGMHWPTGGEHPNPQTIARLPGVVDGVCTILADSARYWYPLVKRPDNVVVWRGLPRPAYRPGLLNWNAKRAADECVNLWNEVEHWGVDYFTPLNELQFNNESGVDFPGFMFVAQFLASLRVELRQRLPGVKLVFPAWCPDQPYMDAPFVASNDWVGEALNWDVLGAHVYSHEGQGEDHFGAANVARSHVAWRAILGPDFPIVYLEWNSNRDDGTDEAMLAEMGRQCVADPNLLGYTYYIWETQRANEQQLSVWGNARRTELFSNPPGLPPVLPEEESTVVDNFPIPQDDNGNEWAPSYQDVLSACVTVAPEYGEPTDELLGLCLAESTWALDEFERWYIYTNEAKGYISARNKAGLQDILNRCAQANNGAGTNDISFGPAHQAWYWWESYPGNRAPGDPHRYNVDEILAFRKQMIQDHGYAIRLAAKQIQPNVQRYGPDSNEPMYRYNKPDGSASAGVKANYDRSRDHAQDILGMDDVAPPQPAPPSGETVFEPYTDPYPAGTFSNVPAGVILHGSRSGKASNPLAAEYAGTANWEVNNPDGLGWNATIGEGKVAVHLTAKQWGWNARSPASSKYLAVEFAQPVVDSPITDSQVIAFCDWFQRNVLTEWPNILLNFPTHAEVENWGETGVHDGKTDVFPYMDARADELRSRIVAVLNQSLPQPAPEPGPPPAAPVTYEQAMNLVGNAYNEDGVVVPALQGMVDSGNDPSGQAKAVVEWLRANRPK